MRLPKKLTVLVLVFAGIMFTLVSGSCDTVSDSVVQFSTENPDINNIDGLDEVVSIQNVFRQIAESVMPAVVSINVEGSIDGYSYDYSQDPYFRWFFGDDYFDEYGGNGQTFEASGSGFIFSEDGYLFSNYHVVEDADRIMVVLSDGREFEAELVGVDEDTDIAVMKIEDDEPFEYCALADSSDMMVGDWVLAIGNPFDLAGTYTFGIVSALEREGMARFQSFIQTDTAVNPGNSGGPLVNIYGQVVGINAAIQTQSGGYEGISFSIPINIAKNVAVQLIENGIVERGYLGLYPSELDEATREALGVSAGQGVMVSRVDANTPAETAGIQRGDIILAFDDEKITGPNQLRLLVANYLPGTEIAVSILRDEETISLNVTLGSRDHPGEINYDTEEAIPEDFSDSSYEFLGATFVDASQSLLSESGESGGVMVYEVERSSALNGVLSYGDLIIGINRTAINGLSDLQTFEQEHGNDRAFTFQVISDGYMYYRGVQID